MPGMPSNAVTISRAKALNNMAEPRCATNSDKPGIFSRSNTAARTKTGNEERNSRKGILIIKKITGTSQGKVDFGLAGDIVANFS